MTVKEKMRGVTLILLAAIVLALSVSFRNNVLTLYAFISFLIIIAANCLTKKLVGLYFETDVRSKFWSWYQFGFKKRRHFKSPIPMVWLPLVLALFSKGFVWWLAILDFEVQPRTERVSRRHGLYRFTEVTEWHMALIAVWAIAINVILAIIGYAAGFELFAKLSIYYAAWSIIPLSSLDGSKIFFGSKILWTTAFIILLIFFWWAVGLPL